MPPKKILIVEDSKTQAIKLKYLLESNGYLSELAHNGKEALSLIERIKFDLIISDIMMPEMNGFELCENLKSNNELKSIPVILLTTLDKIIDVMRGLSIGADNYISKPYNDDYLLHRIDQIINNDKNISYSAEKDKLEVTFASETLTIKPDPEKILNYFISSYEASIHINRALQSTKDQLEELNKSLEQRVKKRTNALETEVESHKKTLKELEKALEKSKSLDMLKTEFMHNLSHEIRTPMNAIIGFTELIQSEDMKNEDLSEFLPHINSSLESLLTIINDMVEAAETMTGNIELVKRDCVLNDIFNELKSKFTGLIKSESKQINKLDYVLPESLNDQEITTYSGKLSTILNKLLSNAVKFTEEGEIEFGAEVIQGKMLKFYVRDTGIGISEDCFEVIFECFKQLQEKHRIKYKGTGVGLAITKKIVNEAGGKIWLKSKPGNGSEFYFTMPYFGELKAIPEPDDDYPKKEVRKDLKNIRILIAEDVETNYYMVRSITEREKMKLVWARNGKEAIEMFKKYKDHIDLILMDIQMPVMDGIEATKRIREIAPEILIIALTAYSNEIEHDTFQKQGFDTVIKKPVRPSKLMEIIKNELISKEIYIKEYE